VTAPRGGGPARSPGASGGARGAIVIGLAVIIGIVGLQILDDSGDGSSGASGSTSVSSVTTSPSTTAPVRAAKDVKVKVYNASGVQGKAQTLTDQLRADGYNMQDPANLDKQRPGTVVECVAGFEREAQLLHVFGVPNSTVAAYPSNPPDGASDADCIVIIGSS
jgi:LytR cell envelope-related transcriptional attenuator